MTSQDGPFIGNDTPESFINFALGQPSPRLLPIDIIAKAAGRLAEADPLLLQYGTSLGYLSFREALAEFLSDASGVEISAENLAMSGAISLSLSLLTDVFARPKDGRRGVVVCEDPTYFLACGVFESAGVDILGIPVDERGLRVDLLRERIDAGQAVDLVYCIPTFQNPSGACLADERREALLDLAVEHDFVVLADEPYNQLYFEGTQAPVAMAHYDAGRDRVISVSSFTKVLAPGLRLGWLQASAPLLKRFAAHGSLRSGGALNPVMAYIVEGVIRSGELAQGLVKLRRIFAERCDAMCVALKVHLPQADFVRPQGGYFVWLRLPDGVDTDALRRLAKRHDVGFCPGRRCAVGSDLSGNLRLSFAFYEAEEIRQGVRRLGRAFTELVTPPNS